MFSTQMFFVKSESIKNTTRLGFMARSESHLLGNGKDGILMRIRMMEAMSLVMGACQKCRIWIFFTMVMQML